MSAQQGRLLLQLTEDSLIAANTGRPFTKGGLKAICYGSLPNKEVEMSQAPFTTDEEARSGVNDVASLWRDNFSRDPDLLQSQVKGLAQTAEDYAGRILFELMQNAADANREQQIGYKSLGFRSLLNITHAPRVHSGHLHVSWSQKRAAMRLGLSGGTRAPFLCLPEWHPLEEEQLEVRSLIGSDGFDTVVVLPMQAGKRQDVQEEWDRVMGDPSILVFIEGLTHVTWRRPEQPDWIWNVQQRTAKSLTIQSGPVNSAVETTWELSCHHDAAVAFRVHDGRVAPLPQSADTSVIPNYTTNCI